MQVLNEIPQAEAAGTSEVLQEAGILRQDRLDRADGLARHAAAWLATPRGATIVISASMVLSLALRLLTLGERSLWVDEAGSLGYGRLDVHSLVDVMGRLELTPPGYYLLVKAWMALGGDSEFWLRLPSALFGVAAILPFCLYLRRAFGPAAAAWGAVLLALAGAQLRYSQEVRVYVILFFLFALGLMLTDRLAEVVGQARPGARRWWLAAALALLTGVMIHLHFTAIFVAATFYVFGFTLLLAQRRLSLAALPPFLVAGLGGLLLATPVFGLALAIAGDPQSAAYWMQVPGPSEVWVEFRQALLAPHLNRLAVPGAGLSLLAFGACLWIRRGHPQVVALSVAFLFAAIVLCGVSMITPILMDRTLLFTLCLYLAILAAGLSAIRRPLLLAVVAGAALLPQAAGSIQQLRSSSFYGEDWDGLAAQLAEQARPGEAILTVGAFEAVALDYYLEPRGRLRTTAAVGDRPGGVNTMAIDLMTEAVPVPKTSLPAGICAGLQGAGGVWVASREPHAFPQLHAAAMQAMQETGAQRLGQWTHDTLILQHWSAPQGCG